MKPRKFLILLIAIVGLCMFSVDAWSAPGASISYQEEDLGTGWWRYDYTFENTSSSEYLYSVWLDFGSAYDVLSTSLPSNWYGIGGIGTTTFLETHTNNTAFDIAPGDSLSGFSFTINAQIGDVPFTAYFDDHLGTRTAFFGTTSPAAVPVIPEPISSVLFVTGGALFAVRNRLRRKRQNV